uniref:Uncharacterized protein n=1 Tax=Cannabis sativa TaxID=3483 RepID=A0A803QDW5_CANSA
MKIDKTLREVLVNDGHFDYYYYYSDNDEDSLEDDDDALSLCNLSLGNSDDEANIVSSNKENSSDSEDDFEFSRTTTESSLDSLDLDQTFSSDDDASVLFCGKSIPCRSSSKPIIPLPQKTTSFHSCRFNNKVRSTTTTKTSPRRCSSLRLPGTEKSRSCQSDKLVSNNSGRSWSRNVFFGLTKIPPKMELTEMRKRQSRSGKVSTIAPLSCEDKPVVFDEQKRGSGPLRLRSNFVSALARVSFRCFRLA